MLLRKVSQEFRHVSKIAHQIFKTGSSRTDLRVHLKKINPLRIGKSTK